MLARLAAAAPLETEDIRPIHGGGAPRRDTAGERSDFGTRWIRHLHAASRQRRRSGQRFGLRLDRTLDRVTVGIMTASLVIGSAIVLTVEGGPRLFGVQVLPVLGLAGYMMAFLNSLWIIYGIWRSGRD